MNSEGRATVVCAGVHSPSVDYTAVEGIHDKNQRSGLEGRWEFQLEAGPDLGQRQKKKKKPQGCTGTRSTKRVPI